MEICINICFIWTFNKKRIKDIKKMFTQKLFRVSSINFDIMF